MRPETSDLTALSNMGISDKKWTIVDLPAPVLPNKNTTSLSRVLPLASKQSFINLTRREIDFSYGWITLGTSGTMFT